MGKHNYSEERIPSGSWTPQERELAFNLRGKHSYKGIANILNEMGYNRTPKAVEHLFARAGLTNTLEEEEQDALPLSGSKTTWGAPLCVDELKVEFGKQTSVVPVLILPDIHADFHDPYAIELAQRIGEIIKPCALVYLGDNVDWCQISKFDNDPYRKTQMMQEVRAWQEIDRGFMSAVGSCIPRYYLLGNHEKRMHKYVCANPELVEIPGMQIENILARNEDFEIIPNLQIIDSEINWRDRFIFKHGDRVRKHSGYTAKAELEEEGVSGISGHTHRCSQIFSTKRGITSKWVENGCLCTLDPTYLKKPNWQQAVSIGWFNANGKNDYFHIDLIPFSKYQAIVNGQFVSVKHRAYG